MRKRIGFRFAFLAMTAVGLLAPSVVGNAEILDESSVGISYALDQYISNLEEKEKETGEPQQVGDGLTCRYPEFEGKCLAYVEESVNVREEPDEDAERVGSLPVNGIALVVDKGETWTKIESGITEGYVRNDFLLLQC